MRSSIAGNISAYPEAIAYKKSNAIVNFCIDDEENNYRGMLVTRPLKLGAPDVHKTVDTIIQRGFFRKGHIKCVLYGSRDLVSWFVVKSSTGHYLRGFGGSPYKYFRLALLCDLVDDENISGCSINYRPRLTNRLR